MEHNSIEIDNAGRSSLINFPRDIKRLRENRLYYHPFPAPPGGVGFQLIPVRS
jgi:hypothetical protein